VSSGLRRVENKYRVDYAARYQESNGFENAIIARLGENDRAVERRRSRTNAFEK
jgi:hypothetical protein